MSGAPRAADAFRGLEEKLSRMVRIPTVCGTPRYAIACYRETLRELFPHVFSAAEETPVGEALLLRIPGTFPDRLPYLLSGHMDVVDAREEAWSVPPFSGEIRDGRVWGRGAQDMKGAQCALLEALDRLLAEGFRPCRSVWLYLSCDEEIGGPTTARAAAWLRERGVRFEAVIDEGGVIGENFWGKLPGRCAMIGVAEKGSLEYRFTARAAGGHASNPPPDTAIVRLARLVADLEENAGTLFRHALSPGAVRVLRAAGQALPAPARDELEEALADASGDFARLRRFLPQDAPLLLGATIAFTEMEAGTAFNVLPEKAVLTANVRPSDVQGERELTALLTERARRYGVECALAGGADASPYAAPDCPAFRLLTETARAVFGEIPAVPFLLAGGTDSKHFLPLAENALRFSPVLGGQGQGGGVHGTDEFITLESLWGAAAFYNVLLSAL